MTTVFVSNAFIETFGDQLRSAAKAAGDDVELMPVTAKHLSQDECDRIDCTFLDRDIRFNDRALYATFEKALVASQSCRWIHLTSSGVNPTPFMDALAKRNAIVTTSTGSNAEPVAQSGLTGLLMLARGFTQYVRGQAQREWAPLLGKALPDDLRGQTLLLIGVGAVGRNLARYARALGLKVVGVRRSPQTPEDPVDELHPPSKLPELLPRADWIVLSCPLTRETRNMLDAAAFARMKKGVRIINIARGEIVNEAALIDALKSGHVAGAHLDAHVKEPLPAESPLWGMPNVIVTPHNASASNGNEKRCAEMFIANYAHWVRGEKMLNVQESW